MCRNGFFNQNTNTLRLSKPFKKVNNHKLQQEIVNKIIQRNDADANTQIFFGIVNHEWLGGCCTRKYGIDDEKRN